MDGRVPTPVQQIKGGPCGPPDSRGPLSPHERWWFGVSRSNPDPNRPAADDLQDIFEYLSETNPNLARSTVIEIRKRRLEATA